MADDANLGVKVASLDARMYGLENTVKGIDNAITGLGAKIDRRSETPWGSIWAACGFAMTVLTVVGAMALNPVKDSVTTVAQAISETNKSVATLSTAFMPKEDIREGFKAASAALVDTNKALAQAIKDERSLADQANRDLATSMDRAMAGAATRVQDYKDMNNDRIDHIVQAMQEIRHNQVQRGEHEEHWKSIDQRFADMQRQITDNKTQLNSIYGARDVIQDLHDNLKDTQERVWQHEGREGGK